MESKTMKKIGDKLSNIAIKIRRASTDDLSGLTKLLGQFFSMDPDFTPNIRKQRQGLASLMANNDATVLVAVIKGETIGMCTLQPLTSTAEGGVVGIVEDLVVDEKWREKGVGSLLLDAIEKVAVEQNMSRLQLLTAKGNRLTREFYMKHQWLETHMTVMRKTF